ncbi:hypothetical protein KQX54_003086 [Cotesia glomerata]|uniref:Uncharacterized protein n=1 Tax=Cotesia glomerata TaxID=32391 RepID=A0AAV7IJ57_COTGL|nr:hypothetical protein KQX54_003086 [Cotesia glomerata]
MYHVACDGAPTRGSIVRHSLCCVFDTGSTGIVRSRSRIGIGIVFPMPEADGEIELKIKNGWIRVTTTTNYQLNGNNPLDWWGGLVKC